MAIPKTIYQTYSSSRLPVLTRWHVRNMRRRNPEYDYQFYDDDRVDDFIRNEYGGEVLGLYRRINIGAAKADLFRYAVLYRRGGVYLDIDSLLVDSLDSFLAPDDRAIISLESNREHYVQWALMYEPEHPFLAKTLDKVLGNLRVNRFPYNVHGMTGPGPYTLAIKECLNEMPGVAHRELGVDYTRHLKSTYPMGKLFLYGLSRKNHWQTQRQQSRPVIT